MLYAENEHEKQEPASVTKVMTLLLVMEAMERGELKYEDTVTVSAGAASMGGSQVYRLCRRDSHRQQRQKQR